MITFAMIKPDAVAAGHTDAILARAAREGFALLRRKQLRLTREVAAAFYLEHAHEDWYEALVDYMCSGPVELLLLEREGDAVGDWRRLIGHRWPPEAKKRDPTCLRALFGTEKLGANAVHGSDSPRDVERELEVLGWKEG